MGDIQDRIDQLSPLKRALLRLDELQAEIDRLEMQRHEPIAIIGLACKLPGARNQEEYWQLLKNGGDAIKEVPSDRWDREKYYDLTPGVKGKMVSRSGGFLDGVDLFDAEFFEISPREAARMDPQHRLLLETSWHAFENAGIPPKNVKGNRSGVFIGISTNDYATLAKGDPNVMDAYSGIGNALCIAANRLSYYYDFHGPSVSVDTACSSSLVAIHMAVKSLRNQETELALAGGVNLILTPNLSIVFSHARMLSPDGQCKTFDASANGYVRGEGCGVVLLKRLSDAIRDENRILAVIYGTSVNQDGRSNGLTAPNGLAQQQVISDAIIDADIVPDDLDYIEAHGTGTSLGDPIEMRSIAKILDGRSKENPCFVGSVKTNIGHLESAAGIAGVIKIVLSLQNEEIPPHLHFKSINPFIPIEEIPIEIPISLTPWKKGEKKRFAGVNSFGFGGTNAHVIIGEAPEQVSVSPIIDRSRHLYCLSSKKQESLKDNAVQTLNFLKLNRNIPLGDIAFTSQLCKTQFDNRISIVSQTTADLIINLDNFIRNIDDNNLYRQNSIKPKNSKIAFLFTGQGSQYVGMSRVLYQTEPKYKQVLDICNEILEPILKRSLFSVIFPDSNDTNLINETGFTQPCLFSLEYALSCLWMSWGIKPDFLVGHSLGEYVASVVSGVFSLEDGLVLISERARLMQSLLQNGEMAAIFAPIELVTEGIKKYPEVSIAAINGPSHVVISGRKDFIQSIVLDFGMRGIIARTLNVSHAFHSVLMEPILDGFKTFARNIKFQEPKIPIISNLTGLPWASGNKPDASYWSDHLRKPVRFAESMEFLINNGCRVFMEIGPQPILINMAKRCFVGAWADEGNRSYWIASLKKDQDEWETILGGLAELYTSGLEIDWKSFEDKFKGQRKIIELPQYVFSQDSHWFESRGEKEAPDLDLDKDQDLLLKENDSDVHRQNLIQRKSEEKGLDSQNEIYSDISAELILNSEKNRKDLLTNYLQLQIGKVLNQVPARISLDKPLNYMGLDSIMAIELKNSLEKEFRINLPIAFLIQGPDINQVANHLGNLIESEKTLNNTNMPSEKEINVFFDFRKEYPLSAGQKALWFQHKIAPASVFNPVQVVRIKNYIDINGVQRAFQHIVDRHQALRTTFKSNNGEPVQVVKEHGLYKFVYEDLSLSDPEFILNRLVDEAHQFFDIEIDPLLRVFIFKEKNESYLIMVYAHHLIVDLWSLAIITNELYQLLANKQDTQQLPLLKSTYLDFVDWQFTLMKGENAQYLWDYWKEQLKGELPILNLPLDCLRPAVQTHNGSVKSVLLNENLSEKIRKFGGETGTTIFTILLAVFKILLFRYSGQEDIIVGTPTTGRSKNEFFNVVGYFVNPLPIRSSLIDGQQFLDYLGQIKEVVLTALNHQDFPLPILVERLRPERDPSILPLFQVMFVYQRSHLLNDEGLSQFAINVDGLSMKLNDMTIENVVMDQKFSAFDLTMTMAQTSNGLGASITYNSDLFYEDTIIRMLGHYEVLLTNILNDPRQSLGSIPLLTDKERNLLINEWNSAINDHNLEKTVVQLFEDQVTKTPDEIAIRFLDSSLTFLELNQKSNQLANYLRKLGIGPDKLVGIFMERSIELVVSILGVMKSGGAYLPLDPIHPYERLSFMFQDAKIPVLITHSGLMDRLPTLIAQPVFIDSYWGMIAKEDKENPSTEAKPDDLAYVIYTSGSTGRSKGVMVQHRGLTNLVKSQKRGFEVNHSSIVLQFASFGFDASVSEMFMALLTGATLVLAKREILLSVPDLTNLLVEQKISVVTLPPSLLAMLPEKKFPSLKTVISAGESCPLDIAERWSFGRIFINAYGPTEATIGPTYYRYSPNLPNAHSVPIGRPIPNTQIYILNNNMEPVPIGLPGEIFIGGVGLARGYLNRPELTEEKFIANPFYDEAIKNNQNWASRKIYRTGDLGRYISDGNIEFLGRVDYQVKIRGFRIELGEIEALINQHPDIRQVVVLVREENPLTKKIIAYLVLEDGKPVKINELRRYLREKLPEYMVPSTFVTMEEFPLNANGKIDRQALPLPTNERLDLEINYVSPKTDLERTIALIWGEVLNVDKIGLNDNFFDLGGHSLLVAKAHSLLQDSLGRDFSLIELFRYPTVSTLAEFLSGNVEDKVTIQRSVERADKQKESMRNQANRMKTITRGRTSEIKNEEYDSDQG